MKIEIKNINSIKIAEKINNIYCISRGEVYNYTMYYQNCIDNNGINSNFLNAFQYDASTVFIKINSNNMNDINKLLEFYDYKKGFQINDMIYFYDNDIPIKDINKRLKQIIISNYDHNHNAYSFLMNKSYNLFDNNISDIDKYNYLLNYYNKLLLVHQTEFELENQNIK